MSEKTKSNRQIGYNKNPKPKTLHKLAFGLGMTVSELLDLLEMNETISQGE